MNQSKNQISISLDFTSPVSESPHAIPPSGLRISFTPQKIDQAISVKRSETGLQYIGQFAPLPSQPERVARELARILIEQCAEKNLLVVLAESCTGGGISEDITTHPGSSRVLDSAMVSYSNESKAQLLSVSLETLEKYGAVSPECATEMVGGLRSQHPGKLALAVTGIAGPGGGTIDKPVGRVYIAVSRPDGSAEVQQWQFHGNRSNVRSHTRIAAMLMLLEAIV